MLMHHVPYPAPSWRCLVRTGHRLSKSETLAGVSGSFSPPGRRNAVSAPPYPCRRPAKADGRYRPAFTQGTDTFAAWSTLSCVVHSQSVHGSLELKAFVYSTDGIEVMVVYGVLWGSWSVYFSPTKKVFLAFPLIKDVLGYFALT